MKIREVEVFPVRQFVYVRITTNDGLSGLGEASLNGRSLAVAGALNHLRDVLDQTARQEGRERLYSLTPQPLTRTVDWVVAVTEQWNKRLLALYDYLAAQEDDHN